MDLFVLNPRIIDLELLLLRLEGSARLETLIALAWHLRQRDCARCLRLADEAEAALHDTVDDVIDRQRALARIHLVRGEVAWLRVDLDAAAQHARNAIAAFGRLDDRRGTGDGWWLLASIDGDRGNIEGRDDCLGSAIADYTASGDQIRIDCATARSLLYATFADLAVTEPRLRLRFDAAVPQHPAVMAWVACARAIVIGASGGYGAAVGCFLEAHHAAIESGQIRQAILAATNAADNFSILGDLDSALEWDDRALALARGTGWPSMIGTSLMQTGNVLRLLGRHAEAESALRESLAVRDGLRDSNGYAITLGYLGDLALDTGNPAAAFDYFCQAEERARTLGGPVPVLRCWRGEATALSRMGRSAEARAKLAAALALAADECGPDERIDTLRACADHYLAHPLPVPEGLAAPSAALHYLQEALALAATIPDYILPSELLDDLAKAHAASGDYQRAYGVALTAAGVRDGKRRELAQNRALAMQARDETARIRVEAERHWQLAETARIRADALHLRQLAATEAERARTLQESNTTLATLGSIGREIIANLHIDDVFAKLHQHAIHLLDVTSFFVYLLEPDGRALNDVFSVEAGQRLPSARIAIDHPTSVTARCAREREEIAIALETDTEHPDYIPGTIQSRSLLFTPLFIGDRLLGVMSIQSTRANAYSERERAIFRTLCAYGAVALDNAAAYAAAESARQEANRTLADLRQAEDNRTRVEAARALLEAQLRESQKMEALGTLAGGVAHDFNNALATISGNVALARQDVGPGHAALVSLEEIAKASRRAKDLVQQILAFGRRQNLELKATSLALAVVETARLVRAMLPATVALHVDCGPETPAVLADSTQVKQILLNLCSNAMHAVRHSAHAPLIEIVLGAVDHPGNAMGGERCAGRLARLTVRDNGSGMDEETRAHIFEPFFTTKPRGEGTGLGLSVVYGIVQAHGATIEVESTPGAGTCFRIDFPAIDTPVEAVAPPVSDARPVHGAHKHVLYVDDEYAIIFLMKRLLERQGYRVSGYTDPREALAVVRANPELFDLAVTDFNMPGMSGLELARALRDVRGDLPVVLASGYITEELRVQAPAAGVRELIYKPDTVDALYEAVARFANAQEARDVPRDGRLT